MPSSGWQPIETGQLFVSDIPQLGGRVDRTRLSVTKVMIVWTESNAEVQERKKDTPTTGD